MNKETIFTLIRVLLTGIGAFLMGSEWFGNKIDTEFWNIFIGAVMAAISIAWGFLDKTVTIEVWESGIRQVVGFAGGLLVSAGKIAAEQVETIIGAVLMLGTFVLSLLSKKKSDNIASHKTNPDDLRSLKRGR